MNGSFGLILVNHGEVDARYQASVTLDYDNATAAEVVVDVALYAMSAKILLVASQ